MNNDFFEFSAYLFRIFGNKDRSAYYELKHLKFENPEVQQFRKLLVALFRLGSEQGRGHYESLARMANRLFPKDKKVPTRGGSLARVTSKFLGWPALYSYNLQGFVISALITRKFGGNPGQGFKKLIQLLGIKNFDADTTIHQAIRFCNLFEKINNMVKIVARHLKCLECSNDDIEVFHYGKNLEDSEFVCSSCGKVFKVDWETAQELAGELLIDIYKPIRTKDLLYIPQPTFCRECNNNTVILDSDGLYRCIWCGMTYTKACVECGEPFQSEEGEIICDECFRRKMKEY